MEKVRSFPLRAAPDRSLLSDAFPHPVTTVTDTGHLLTLLPGVPPNMRYAAAFSQHIVNLFGTQKPHANYWVDAARQSRSVSGSRAFQRWRPGYKKSNIPSSEVLQ